MTYAHGFGPENDELLAIRSPSFDDPLKGQVVTLLLSLAQRAVLPPPGNHGENHRDWNNETKYDYDDHCLSVGRESG